MPIHLNLLAEAQAAEDMRRRDPVKRATIIGALLVMLALAWGGMAAINFVLAREALKATQMVIESKTNEFREVEMAQRQMSQDKFKLTALQKYQAARFLQGSLLNALQQATAEGVQLTRLRLDQSYSTMTVAAKTNESRIRETIVLHLSAKDSSANPGEQVSKFQTIIAKQPYFEVMLNKTNPVQLAGPPSALQPDAAKPYVTFMLNCFFPDQIR